MCHVLTVRKPIKTATFVAPMVDISSHLLPIDVFQSASTVTDCFVGVFDP